MIERVPCSECGAEILPVTAAATGGVCMACKQGIRKNMEESKEYYRQLKEYDPYRELWTSLVRRVHRTEEGYAGLTDDERAYFAAGLLEGEVYNGGMDQFFSNHSGEVYEDAVNALLDLGAVHSLRLLTRASEILFDGKQPPKDTRERRETMRREPDGESGWFDELEEIDRQYYEDPDGLGDKLAEFARTSGLLSPFERPEGDQELPLI
jgi:hypothetical protein